MIKTNKLLIATTNAGKIAEYRCLLSQFDYQLTTPIEEGISIVVNETSTSYRQNAKLKALAYSKYSGLTTIADDSGLEVDALNGIPGVLSARFAGDMATDTDNTRLLLAKLKNTPWDKRTAHFTCVIAISNYQGKVKLCKGICFGIIAFEPAGSKGFGYDPIFYLPEFNKTMAEISQKRKNEISHRAKAIIKAQQILKQSHFISCL